MELTPEEKVFILNSIDNVHSEWGSFDDDDPFYAMSRSVQRKLDHPWGEYSWMVERLAEIDGEAGPDGPTE